MLNILDQRKKNLNNSTSSLVVKQSSVVVLRKNKFKTRIGKYILLYILYILGISLL